MDWTEALRFLLNPVGTSISDGPAAWNALKTQAQNWAAKVIDVYNTPAPPALQSERSDLLSRAKFIKEKIESIFGTFDALNNVNLGVIPLIVPVAVIAAAAALITKWVLDYNTYKSKLNQYNAMVGSGMSPNAAANLSSQIASTADQNSIMGKITAFAPWLLGGFLLWQFKDKLK